MNKAPINPVLILSGGDLSQATVTTNPTNVLQQDNLVYQVNITGASADGTIDVETSTDYNPITNNAGNWVPLGISASCVVAGVGTGIIDFNQAGPAWVRLKFTRVSGTGSMDVYISGKQV